ncbi:MAG: MarR family EPS-associated transcriptional regulator [Acidobacteriota bacterium]
MPTTLSHEVRYRLLKHLAEHPDASQRELARQLGVSVGKVNYCLKALIEKGWVKARNFRNSNHKAGYLYILTPRGIEEKVSVTSSFLRRKLDEYDLLSKEIERLTREVSELGPAPAGESAEKSTA